MTGCICIRTASARRLIATAPMSEKICIIVGANMDIRNEAPEWEQWIVYFLSSLQRQKARLEATIERENLLIVNVPELSVQILELAKAHGRIRDSQIVGMAGAHRNAVKKPLRALVSAGHLAQYGSGRGAWYGCV